METKSHTSTIIIVIVASVLATTLISLIVIMKQRTELNKLSLKHKKLENHKSCKIIDSNNTNKNNQIEKQFGKIINAIDTREMANHKEIIYSIRSGKTVTFLNSSKPWYLVKSDTIGDFYHYGGVNEDGTTTPIGIISFKDAVVLMDNEIANMSSCTTSKYKIV